MKTTKYLFCLIFFIVTTTAIRAQTVYAGENTIDKAKVSGLYLTVQGDGKQIENDWETQLKTYGRVASSRGTYRITNASIPAISLEPINLMSTVKSSRKDATIFAAFDLGNGNFLTAGSPGYSAAETMLKDFASTSLYNQEVRTAQGNFDDAQKNHQKMVRNGERLQRDIENNAKEKDKLLKRLDDNAKELEKLEKDIETNKTDQSNAMTDLDSRKTNLETVKAKKNN